MTKPAGRTKQTVDRLGPARALIADLRDLALDLDVGSYTQTTLAMCDRNLRRVVPEALGATIRVELDRAVGVPIEIHLLARTVESVEIACGLEVSLTGLGLNRTGAILFYATSPGAFDELTADLTSTLGLGAEQLNTDPQLPSSPIDPSITGLDDYSQVNRALGVLLNRGHGFDDARADLQRRATAARSTLPDAARTLLRSTG